MMAPKALDKWLPGYLRSVWLRPRVRGLRHLMVCVADHFEPFRGGASDATARDRVGRWVERYPQSVFPFLDNDGVAPRHTFFYPAEEYDRDVIDQLAGLCRGGHGEVEIHLHHRHDTAEGLSAKLVTFRDRLRGEHGLLGDVDGAPRYGFVHGNWALCNSRPDGDWCGVNDELGVLAGTGCYADFTFPSAPSATQPRMVNAIYRGTDTGRPRAADRGLPVRVRGESGRDARGQDGSLMLVQGPLALNWGWRKWGMLPRVENGELTGANPPTPGRVALWVRQHVHVCGRPDWVFVKLHTHGCVEANADVLLGDAVARMHAALQAGYGDGERWRLHYVTAREMFNIIRAAEDGMSGDPGAYRDYAVGPPPRVGKGGVEDLSQPTLLCELRRSGKSQRARRPGLRGKA